LDARQLKENCLVRPKNIIMVSETYMSVWAPRHAWDPSQARQGSCSGDRSPCMPRRLTYADSPALVMEDDRCYSGPGKMRVHSAQVYITTEWRSHEFELSPNGRGSVSKQLIWKKWVDNCF
jgi:hypothetical protein